MKNLVLGLSLTAFTSTTLAYTECSRPVRNVWNNLGPAKTVWVTFNDGGGAISKAEGQISEAQMSRFFSMALAAQAQDKNLLVRYPDEITCPPSNDRNDVDGVWIQGQ